MACSGSHCSYHNTGWSHCAGHRQPNTPSGAALTAPAKGQKITQAYIDNVRNQIRIELERWKQHGEYYTAVVNPTPLNAGVARGAKAENETINLYYQKINEVDNKGAIGHAVTNPPSSDLRFIGGPADDVVPSLADLAYGNGALIRADDLVALINHYNAIRMDCICHADCYCNNVCACHNDCGCNYSDKRLKREIEYC